MHSFTTLACDDDGDGISDDVENGAPNDGDANSDGIADNLQANVTSFVNPITGQYTTVALSDGCELSDASVITESTTSNDAGYVYQAGLVNFSASCSGSETEVSMYQFGASASSLILRKFNPNTGVYFTITDATITQQTIGGQSAAVASYTITDNGPLDLNPAVGQITDPVGLASAVGAPNTGAQTVRDRLFH